MHLSVGAILSKATTRTLQNKLVNYEIRYVYFWEFKGFLSNEIVDFFERAFYSRDHKIVQEGTRRKRL